MDDTKPPGAGDRIEDHKVFLFPKWTNLLPTVGAIGAVIGALLVTFVVWYYFSPRYTDAGYAPVQPVPYSHKLHAGDLGIDCRYCHVNVERSAHATVPATQVCMNCHAMVKTDSEKLKPVRDSYATGEPIPWVKIHKIPDYAYFDHSRHVVRGVGCVSCHGRIDQMEVVRQIEPLSMSWCLDCHRDPAPNMRPIEAVTWMDWKPPGGDARAFGTGIVNALEIVPPQDCSGCHR